MMNDISSEDSKTGQFSLIGGFLGAGKTTLIGRYAKWLQEQGLRVALVTNDQGEGLIDTASAREALGRESGFGNRGGDSSVEFESEETGGLVREDGGKALEGIEGEVGSDGRVGNDGPVGRLEKPHSRRLEKPHSRRLEEPHSRRLEKPHSRGLEEPGSRVAEITAGCFCCRLDELVGTIQQLAEEGRPDVLIAEPVGSCTDLMATVIRPLEQVYETSFALSPLAVVLDARRALASLGGKRSKRSFHRDVGYIYRKQLEEAEWLVVNKCDLLAKEDLTDLLQRLEKDYPGKWVFVVSARTGEGLENLFEALRSHETAGGTEVEVDYQRYAEGEALLGWVNSEAQCHAPLNFDWERWLIALGQRIGELLDEGEHEVGHFKMSVTANGTRYRVHQVMGGEGLEGNEGVSPSFSKDQNAGGTPALPSLLVNLRAEGEAKILEALVTQAVAEQSEVEVTFSHQAAFQPGEPVPVHRIAAA